MTEPLTQGQVEERIETLTDLIAAYENGGVGDLAGGYRETLAICQLALSSLRQAEPVKHPTYGTLRQLIDEIHAQLKEDQFPRIGQMGALYWFAARPTAAPAGCVVPEGFKLVAVKGFDDLIYWLGRCADKGHLDNCSDLIEPWAAFDYRDPPGEGEKA